MARIQLWKDAERCTLDPTLFSEKAERMAKDMAKENEISKGKENKRTQIRRFYDEVVRLDLLAQKESASWEAILPMVHMLVAKAAYAKGRKLISDGFLDFIKSSVEQIHRQTDLEVFSNYFEAFMGFYRLHGPNN
ncbi:MAG: type III-A CRISPR-associated protein Csm2 [Pseudomonadota bacterium]